LILYTARTKLELNAMMHSSDVVAQ